ncbi:MULTISPECIES: hydrogenase nickel incorporation protein HypB [Deefgea]|uniref:Hydrogenase maturation factor HypB n=1 Tax=Deefgea chitinilytica TaxID=570276 RepID=A0ABS2C9Y4_9NEIS|nr:MULTISPECIES: hydrogenase nickel incorporation protein HypB [Deefgea]MBM5570960.1 hydrogenase nickel incorporation protein HypB [Deefgea chitinilytica]MBM9888190.1 hydrogenase nickel incorporation protein HypB [Deefgea sp. CFH1-16]
MCTTCGCGHGETTINGIAPVRRKRAAGAAVFGYRVPTHAEHAEPTVGPLGAAHAPEVDPERTIRLEHDILASNDALAEQNRQRFAAQGIFALNLVSSPGSGKTTLLVETIKQWQGHTAVAVIEGDQQTANDADRIRATGAPAVQINTGKGCHLDAHMVAGAIDTLADEQALMDNSLLLIENVGNLVCPAAFDLGEAHKVAILSVTEGEDKPLKYPDMFRAADLMILSKTDLLPYLDFNVDAAISMARQVRPNLEVICLSTKTGEGMDQWLAWLKAGCRQAQQ